MENKCSLKIGLDFHGVIDRNPAYFADFSRFALAQGCEIHVITGGPEALVKQQLQKWNVEYTNVFAILDYYEKLHQVVYTQNGNFHIKDELWNNAKAEYCRSCRINIHIDDSLVYARCFTTPYCRYDKQRHDCQTVSGKVLDFHQSPQVVLTQIKQLLQF